MILAFLNAQIKMAPFWVWAYNGPMEIVNFPTQNFQNFGARGVCPHCGDKSYFRPVTSPYTEGHKQKGNVGVIGCQCEGCKQFMLVQGTRANSNQAWFLDAVFPMGSPNDAVDANVDSSVAKDFSEALRCQFIKSFRATVVMCRRAIQTSAISLKAEGGRLIDQIDDLFAKGKITEPLKDFAHEVRLTGNDGAHPDRDGLSDVSEKDAEDIIEFTREYLHHVYVMPAKLKARKGAIADQAESSNSSTPQA